MSIKIIWVLLNCSSTLWAHRNLQTWLYIELNVRNIWYMYLIQTTSACFLVYCYTGVPSWLAPCRDLVCLGDLTNYSERNFRVPGRATQVGPVVSQRPDNEQLFLLSFVNFSSRCPFLYYRFPLCCFLFLILVAILPNMRLSER